MVCRHRHRQPDSAGSDEESRSILGGVVHRLSKRLRSGTHLSAQLAAEQAQFLRVLTLGASTSAEQDDGQVIDTVFRKIDIFKDVKEVGQHTGNWEVDRPNAGHYTCCGITTQAAPCEQAPGKTFDQLMDAQLANAIRKLGTQGVIITLKPLLVDMLKRRQTFDRNFLSQIHSRLGGSEAVQKHLHERDFIVALLSVVGRPHGQMRVASYVAKADGFLPLLSTWGSAAAPDSSTTSLETRANFDAFSMILSYPLVLNVGTRFTAGKTTFLRECFDLDSLPLRRSVQWEQLLPMHQKASLDLLVDMASDRPKRGIILGDLHGYCCTVENEEAERMVATLAAGAQPLVLVHISPADLVRNRLSPSFCKLAGALCGTAGAAGVKVALLLRDADQAGVFHDDALMQCIGLFGERLVGVWRVPDLRNQRVREDLRKAKNLVDGPQRLLEDLFQSAKSGSKMPCIHNIQSAYEALPSHYVSNYASHLMMDLTDVHAWKVVFPQTDSSVEIANLLQTRQRVSDTITQFSDEDAQAQKYQRQMKDLDHSISNIEKARPSLSVHRLMEFFARLVDARDFVGIMKLEACLQELNGRLHTAFQEQKEQLGKDDFRLKQELYDFSIDACWLELMYLSEVEARTRTVATVAEDPRRRATPEGQNIRGAYHAWAYLACPLPFLHHTPLQFGAYNPQHWASKGKQDLSDDFLGNVLNALCGDREVVVVSVIGAQSSGKSFLMNYLFGSLFKSKEGRATKGIFISVFDADDFDIVVLDTEGLLSIEARGEIFDKQMALMTISSCDLCLINQRGEMSKPVQSLLEVCLFALQQLPIAHTKPTLAFVLQNIAEEDPMNKHVWMQDMKSSLDAAYAELSRKSASESASVQDLVMVDDYSMRTMPPAFHQEVGDQGVSIKRPTRLYALRALQLRQFLFKLIDEARLRKRAEQAEGTMNPRTISEWYAQARQNWQVLSRCGSDVLEFKTMAQVVIAQELSQVADSLNSEFLEKEHRARLDQTVAKFKPQLSQTTDYDALEREVKAEMTSLENEAELHLQNEFEKYCRKNAQRLKDPEMKRRVKRDLITPSVRMHSSYRILWARLLQKAREDQQTVTFWQDVERRIRDALSQKDVTKDNLRDVFEQVWRQMTSTFALEISPEQRVGFWNDIKKRLDMCNQQVAHEFVLMPQQKWFGVDVKFNRTSIDHLQDPSLVSPECLRRPVQDLHAKVQQHLRISLPFLKSPKVVQSLKSVATHVDEIWKAICASSAAVVEVWEQQHQVMDKVKEGLKKINNAINSIPGLDNACYDRLNSIDFFARISCSFAAHVLNGVEAIERMYMQQRAQLLEDHKQEQLANLLFHYDAGRESQHLAQAFVAMYLKLAKGKIEGNIMEAAHKQIQDMTKAHGLDNPESACQKAMQCFGLEPGFPANWRKAAQYVLDPTQYLYAIFHEKWEANEEKGVRACVIQLEKEMTSLLQELESVIQGLDLEQGGSQTTSGMVKLMQECPTSSSCASILEDLSCCGIFGQVPGRQIPDLPQYRNSTLCEVQNALHNMKAIEFEGTVRKEFSKSKALLWDQVKGCNARCPTCRSKCNRSDPNHAPDTPHQCNVHLLPAFGGFSWSSESKVSETFGSQKAIADSWASRGKQKDYEVLMHERLKSVSAKDKELPPGSCMTLHHGPGAPSSCRQGHGWHFWCCHYCNTVQYGGACVNSCDWGKFGWTCIEPACLQASCGCRLGAAYWKQHGTDWVKGVTDDAKEGAPIFKHCCSKQVWDTRVPIELDGHWGPSHLQVLQAHHPDWLEKNGTPTDTYRPDAHYDDPTDESDRPPCKELAALRRAWRNMQEFVYELYPHFVRDDSPEWTQAEAGNASHPLQKGDLSSIQEELYTFKPPAGHTLTLCLNCSTDQAVNGHRLDVMAWATDLADTHGMKKQSAKGIPEEALSRPGAVGDTKHG